jgi:hypothetical protein
MTTNLKIVENNNFPGYKFGKKSDKRIIEWLKNLESYKNQTAGK